MMYHLRTVIIVTLLIAWAGCGSTKPSRLYTLTAVSDSGVPAASNMVTQDLGIGIGPIKIPDALDRPELVVRTGPNEIKVAQFDRWAGSFKDDFASVLSENLSTLLSTDKVFLYPWRGVAPVEYQIIIDVIQFDGKPGKGSTLTARWLVVKRDREEIVVMKRSRITQNTNVAGYEGLVAAHSQVLAELSREIAEGIKGLLERGSN